MHKSTKADFFLPFGNYKRLSSSSFGGFVWIQRKRTRVLKHHDWSDLLQTLAMGELSRVQVQLLSINLALRRGARFEDPRTCWPNDGKPSACMHPPAQPVVGFQTLWCEAFSAERLWWPKKVLRQDKQAETDLTIQFAPRTWLRHRLPPADQLAHRCAQAGLAETWYRD